MHFLSAVRTRFPALTSFHTRIELSPPRQRQLAVIVQTDNQALGEQERSGSGRDKTS